jgi:anaerobic magnesium-protoporphyrin IX monomethyl ester cyclase
MKKRVLLINPPSSVAVYNRSKITAAVPQVPVQSLATLGAVLLRDGYEVRVLDLMLSRNPEADVISRIREFQPDAVGVTFTTPLYNEALWICEVVKRCAPQTLAIAGGVHPTTLPEDTLHKSRFDVVVVGEGDITLPELLAADDVASVKGICYRSGGDFVRTEPRPLVQNLDDLPFPAMHLYDIHTYHTSRITSKRNPVGGVITGRGCAFDCTFCNKSVFGRKFRPKSPAYVLEEIKYLIGLGYREIHVLDDLFTMDMRRAKRICELIVDEGLDITINLFSGLRVNTVDRELLDLLKAAGCYSISYGPESGNQELLNNIKKGITLDQSRHAMALTKEMGFETVGFFMFGLPGETEETMWQTINFAIELDPDYAKVTLLLPFPSTPLFDELEEAGRILSRDWQKYNFHCTAEVWQHPNLSWDTLKRYYNLFYRKFYLRPRYIAKRFRRGLLTGDVFFDAVYMFRNFF